MAKTKPLGYDVRFVRTEVELPHLESTITFLLPHFGRDNYLEVGKVILEGGLRLPTDENASLFHALYCGPESFTNSGPIQKARNYLTEDIIFTFRNRIWIPEGVYSIRDSKAEGTRRNLVVGELEDILHNGEVITESGVMESKDGSVRFAPINSYDLGRHSSEDFAKQGDVIIDYGVEGAKKLAETAEKLKRNPRTHGVKVSIGQEPVERCSVLYLDCGEAGFNVDGGFNAFSFWDGIALGIQK